MRPIIKMKYGLSVYYRVFIVLTLKCFEAHNALVLNLPYAMHSRNHAPIQFDPKQFSKFRNY